jgi:hypothetical protein
VSSSASWGTMDGARLTRRSLGLAILLRSIPTEFAVRAGFDSGRATWRPERHGGVPAAGEPAVLFLPANTARQPVGVSVGIGSNRRRKSLQIQLVMASGGYRPGGRSRAKEFQQLVCDNCDWNRIADGRIAHRSNREPATAPVSLQNDLSEPQQTRSNADETRAKSTKLIDSPPLITVWLKVGLARLAGGDVLRERRVGNRSGRN